MKWIRWQRVALVSGALIVATAIAYAGVMQCAFVDFDDPYYVTQNARVQSGLSLDNLRWAFSTGYFSNWHPLTWISLMVDVEVFAGGATAFHLANLLFHLVNTLLLLWVMFRMTGQLWPSALVAALFALHPLHVESVAWVSARKDVLSTFFGLATIWAYIGYTEHGGVRRYLWTSGLFALGLMAKPMLVTWPVVLLLLDLWPLNRIGTVPGDNEPQRLANKKAIASELKRLTFGRAVLEKIPLLLLSAASSVVTYTVQQAGGAVGSTELIPIGARLANALVAYVRYLGKTFWPSRLSVLYPYPGEAMWSALEIGAAAVLLVVITVAILRLVRRPYATVGWLWYLGTLVPVIGLVHIGSHSIADRYTYIPLIGIFIIVAWSGCDLMARMPNARWVLRTAVGTTTVVLVALATRTSNQVSHWQSSNTLYNNALAVTPENPVIHNNLGIVLQKKGKLEEAIGHYRAALHIKPDYHGAHNSLGTALAATGQLAAAISHYRRALQISPGYVDAFNNLGIALARQGRHAEAIDIFRQALAIRPNDANTHNNLGVALQMIGARDDAIAHYRQALVTDPLHSGARRNLDRIAGSDP
jgi:tetratricopeptide (TPR) repeat protein